MFEHPYSKTMIQRNSYFYGFYFFGPQPGLNR